MIPVETRAQLRMLRESFSHSNGHQSWLAGWWSGLPLEDRRLLLALVGLDDSPEFGRRQWRQMLPEHRETLVSECKRIGKMLEAMKWA